MNYIYSKKKSNKYTFRHIGTLKKPVIENTMPKLERASKNSIFRGQVDPLPAKKSTLLKQNVKYSACPDKLC